MDERLRICLWMLGCGGIGAVLGGAFGALAGYLSNEDGGAAGTRFGRWVADSFTHTAEREPSPAGYAALVGLADGFLFLGVLGTLAGTVVALFSQAEPSWLGMVALGSTGLVGGAVLFGSMAYTLTRHTAEFLYAVMGSFFGSLLAARLIGSIYGPIGLVPGMMAGLLLGRLVRRYSPKFQPPRTEKGRSYLHTDSDAIRKPEDGISDGERSA